MEGRYNLRSPAVKRLMREAKELSEATTQYYAQPLEDNLFEWHFTVQGPADSDFESGRYHGRIILPPEYPMKPPSIMLLTPNGRFELNKKICLSMSAHHPETWQPSWSIRTVLLAIIGFMPSKGGGAIGALDYTGEERKILARKSVTWTCDTCGSNNADSLKEENPGHKLQANKEDLELASQINFKGENEVKSETKTHVDGSGDIPNGDTLTSEQNIEEISIAEDERTSKNTGETPQETSSNVARKRTRKSTNQRQENRSSSVQSTGSQSNGHFSLFLILIFTLCIIILVLRRIYYK